jgi:hypothetical protein
MEYKKYEKQGFYAGQPLRASQLVTIEEGIIEAQKLSAESNIENGSSKGSLQQVFSEAHGSYSTALNVGEAHGRYSFAVGSGSIAG